MRYLNTLRFVFNRRLQTIFLLGFSSGLPLLLVGSTLQAWYTMSGVSLIVIGMLSLIGQPYTLKFLWAPFLDRFMPPLGGRRRGWIFISQIGLVIFLVAMAWNDPAQKPLFLAILALVVAFLSATQDIVIDAYRTEMLTKNEFSLGAALNLVGYRMGVLVAGGGAMVLADQLGFRVTYMLMATLLALLLIVTYFAPPIQDKFQRPASLYDAIVKPFQEFLSRDAAWRLLLFMVLYRLADAFAVSLSAVFLLRGVGFSLTDVGAIYKVVGLLATLLGSVVGGIWMTKLTRYSALLIFGVLQGFCILPFMLLAIVGKSYVLMIVSIFSEAFCNGLTSVAFVAFLMDLCDKRYTATQFALFTSLAAVTRVLLGPIAGVAVTYMGWAWFFFYAFLLSFPTLGLLISLRDQISALVKGPVASSEENLYT